MPTGDLAFESFTFGKPMKRILKTLRLGLMDNQRTPINDGDRHLIGW